MDLTFLRHALFLITMFPIVIGGLKCYRCVHSSGSLSLTSIPGASLSDYARDTGGACRDPEGRLSLPDLITTAEPSAEPEAIDDVESEPVASGEETTISPETTAEVSATTEEATEDFTGSMEMGDGDNSTDSTRIQDVSGMVLSVLTSNDTEECDEDFVCSEAVLSVSLGFAKGTTVIRGCLPIDIGPASLSQEQLENAGFNVTTCNEDLCNWHPYSAAESFKSITSTVVGSLLLTFLTTFI